MVKGCDHYSLSDSLRTLLELFDTHEIENLSLYYHWHKGKKLCMIQLNSTIEEFMDEV